MQFCDKLLTLRKRYGYSQEQLADLLKISRQSVSKWESGQAMPELCKIIQISDIFSVPVDDLVRDERELLQESGLRTESRSLSDAADDTAADLLGVESDAAISEDELLQNIQEMKDTIHQISNTVGAPVGFEYKSPLTIGGIPLVHIHLSKIMRTGVFQYNRICVAKGIFAVGDMAFGVVSLGAFSFGILPIGAISVGLVAIGAVSLGVIALGASAIGVYTIGAASVGLRAAVGISASARTAIGTEEAKGLYQMVAGSADQSGHAIQDFLLSHTPEMPRLLARFMALFVR